MLLVTALQTRSRALLPGVTVTLLVAASAAYLSAHLRAPPMLLALLFGIGMNYLMTPSCKPGIEFAARDVLRVGVALLGTRITFEQIVQLGWHPIVLVIVSVVATILFSAIAARLVGFNTLFGFLTGGATAICGASAALALSASLPAHPAKEIATAFTIIGASVVSVVAMIAYPILARHLELSAVTSGVFIGGSIHEVAHVVGAGYSISRETGDIATIKHQRDTSFVKVCSGPPIQPMLLIPASSTKATANHGSNGGRSDGAALLSVRRVSIAAQAITGTSIATRISFTIVAMSPVSREML